jgi:hypothetical protein
LSCDGVLIGKVNVQSWDTWPRDGRGLARPAGGPERKRSPGQPGAGLSLAKGRQGPQKFAEICLRLSFFRH